MSIGPLGNLGASAAGTPLAQVRGKEVDRSAEDTAVVQRRTASEQRAELAGGIGQADGENHETTERDADGRRPWEFPGRNQPESAEHSEEHSAAGTGTRKAVDPTGQSGSLLDLIA